MGININLGAWNGVFAVPNDVVDKYIRLATEKQLKVLLWLLRNAGSEYTAEEMAQALSVHPLDIGDYIQFWVNAGLLCKMPQGLAPAQRQAENTIKPVPEEKADGQAQVQQEKVKAEKKKPRALSRPQKPDSAYVAKRLSESGELSFLMEEAQVILGRPLSGGDSATLLMLHEDDGLPVDVILMILQYAVGEGKTAMRYVERVGADWASEDIDSVEKAEEKLRAIAGTKDAWRKVSRIFGLNSTGSPTKTQLECAGRWVNEWKYQEEMLRLAYETCVDTKGEYNLKYIDGIIKRWHSAGIMEPQDVENAKKPKKKETAQKRGTSYDIDELESLSMFDD